jgi:hypothetical protein
MPKNGSGKGQKTSAAKWLPVQGVDYWQRLQVFPSAIGHAATKADYERRARSVLEKLGHANLRYLADAASITYRADADSPQQLSNRIFCSSARHELICLATFLRPRVSAVVEFFDSNVVQLKGAAIESEIANLSRGAPETPKPLTKLVAIYKTNPADLESIHYRYAWRRLPTLFEFATAYPLKTVAPSTLETAIPGLVKALDKVKSGESYEFFGRRDLSSGTSVFVLHRHYPPSVRPDYESDFRLQHDYSLVVFAFDVQRKTLLVKVANRSISKVIADWAGDALDCVFVRAGGDIFANYKPESVEHAFLGGYDESLGIDLIAIRFRHSFAPNHSQIGLSAIAYSKSIREDLAWLKAQGILRMRSLADIDSLKIRYDGSEAEVTCEIEKQGAIRLHLNDSNIADDRTEKLKETFRATFGIPLGQRIDPTLLTMGATEVYHFLLSGVTDDQLLDYHKEPLGKLLGLGLLKVSEIQLGHCTDTNCSAGPNQKLTDTTLTECPACQGKINWNKQLKYVEDAKAVTSFAKKLIADATRWKMAATVTKFESHAFHRLFPKADPNRTVCVFINSRLKGTKFESFQRAMFPIMVVHPQGSQRMPILDESGIAHVGLPYAISAMDDHGVWKSFKQGCKDVIQRLMRMEQERILRVSRHSYENLKKRPEEYDDRKYEADTFNVLRSLFPYTVKWGGGNRPDGFSSLVYFEGNNLGKPTTFNWSYDAKFTDSVYPFDIKEFDKMFRYVSALFQPKRLKALGNKYNAHAIITNGIDDGAMRNAADYLWNQHRLGKDHQDFLLVFIRDSFLTQLWKRVREDDSAFGKRRSYLPEYLVKTVLAQRADGFSMLDEAVADELADEVLREPEIESPLDHEALKEDLKRVTKSRAKPGNKSSKPPR